MTETLSTPPQGSLAQSTAALIVPAAESPLTPLAQALELTGTPAGPLTAPLAETRGARTPALFSDASAELFALLTGVAAFDHGARTRLRIVGDDRVRWLNGMVTNSVKALTPGEHHYSFVLNAQGRIQGDATIHDLPGELLLETDRAQLERLHAHLDHFIIMDDVELHPLPGETALGLAGPGAAALLHSLGLPAPAAEHFSQAAALSVTAEHSPAVPRYTLWIPEGEVLAVWQHLLAAGAMAAGAHAVEALRILEGTPLYGVDITDKTLAQETGQIRALNFNKGCYLGQEIVERIRARASVHKGVRQLVLTGDAAAAGVPLTGKAGAPAGELTSIAQVRLAGYPEQVALGIVRLDAPGEAGLLHYPGGEARLLPRSPLSTLPLDTATG